MPEPVVRIANGVVLQNEFPLLSGVNLTINPGTVTVLTGSNGAGKTSLLRLLAGLLPLTSGEGIVAGVSLRTDDRRLLRRRVGWLGHEGSFYRDLSVRENLAFAASAFGRPQASIDPALERVGLLARATTSTKSLSAGQRRRLALAWLLIRRPELWLLDEPYAALDPQGRTFFDDLLVEAVSAGVSVVLSAHDALGSAALPRTTVQMVGGRIVEAQ